MNFEQRQFGIVLFSACAFCTPLHILVLYMLLIVFSTTNLADVVDLRGNRGAAIKHYLLVCVLGGLFEQSYIHTRGNTKGFVVFCALCECSSSFSLSDCL